MPAPIEVETPHLRLRQWRHSDRAPFAAMNADPTVMEFFPSLQSRAASDASIDTWQTHFAERGWSNWAVELRWSGEFIGFIGLSVPNVFSRSPLVSRLAGAWLEALGSGVRDRRGACVLRVGFEQLALSEIVSFTSVLNLRSRAVMERIGMRNAEQDFEHPGVPENHRLRPHCLYRITRAQWSENAA